MPGCQYVGAPPTMPALDGIGKEPTPVRDESETSTVFVTTKRLGLSG